MLNKTVSIIGCGWVGWPLAERLLTAGLLTKGSTTTPEKLPLLKQAHIDAYLVSLSPEPVGDLAALLQADTVIIDIPPKAGKLGDSFHPQQIRHLTNAIRSSPVQHVIYISSTSVYPESNRVVVETDVTEPAQSAAPAFIEAEQLIHGLAPEQVVTIVRFGGLVGYNRIPGKYVSGRTVDSGAVPVNYIHRDDAVGLLTTVVEQRISGTFNAVAPEHPTREAVYRKSCAEFGYELPNFAQPTKPVPFKIISPEKLIRATNYSFLYPDPLQFLYRL
ncbi:Rossmann-fold NAD(P)-binding domain-containing protein [Spirosoma koreense]